MDYNKQKNKWSSLLFIGHIVGIIDFLIMVNQEKASIGGKISATILLIDIVFCIISVVMVCINKAKLKNLSAEK